MDGSKLESVNFKFLKQKTAAWTWLLHLDTFLRWAAAHRLLVSLIKVTLPDCNDCDRSSDVWQSHSLVHQEVTMFFGLWDWLWVCVHIVQESPRRVCACCTWVSKRREERSSRPLVSGPASDKSKRRIYYSPRFAVGFYWILSWVSYHLTDLESYIWRNRYVCHLVYWVKIGK